MTSKEIKKSLENPATSYWLKNAIEVQDKRDICDAMRDVHILQLFLEAKGRESGL